MVAKKYAEEAGLSAPRSSHCSSSGLTVAEFIEQLSHCNPDAAVRFSIADDSSDDPGERWFCEDGIEAMFDNGHPELPASNATEVTICLVGKSNLSD